MYSFLYVLDHGLFLRKRWDSLANTPAERVSASMGHRIRNGQPRSDLGERIGWAPAGTVISVAAPWPKEGGAHRR